MSKNEKCVLTEIKFKSDKWSKAHPIITSFQNGDILPSGAETLKCSIIEDEQNSGNFAIEATSGSIKYKGSLSSCKHSTCRTMLAIRNKKTNHIRLIEANSVLLTPCGPSVDSPGENSLLCPVSDTAFFSKKAKRYFNMRERMKFDVGSITDQLVEAASVKEIKDEDLVIPSLNRLNAIIPYNRDATTVEEMYQLENIISQVELDSLENEAERLLNNLNDVTEEEHSNFFNHYFKCLPMGNELHSIKLLLYTDCLLKCLSMPLRDLRKKKWDTICPYSKVVGEKIRQKFCSQVKHERMNHASLKDQFIGFVIILGLMCNNFKLNLEPLAKSVRISNLRLQQISSLLGAVPVSKGTKSLVQLKLMSELPPKTIKSSRKRRRK